MPRVYFHLHDGVDMMLDEDGNDVKVEDIVARALIEARAIIADEARQGRIDLRPRIDVEDANGTVVHRLCFTDAVEIIGPD
jgi:hypothetical protein